MQAQITIGNVEIGPDRPLAVIAGPCVLESPDTNRRIADHLKSICAELGLPLVFKASFDKANRTSMKSHRGPGLSEGLTMLAALKDEFQLPITTDVHQPEQAAEIANVADVLQIPAFLCRQTDLLQASAETGRPVNVKKGQFLSPAEMRHPIEKLASCGCNDVMLTERGTFFGYNRLVNDFIGLGDLMDLGAPVCFDVTHSTQLPGGGTDKTAGRPDRAHLLARAAVAAGVHAIFIECHPDPATALSDGSTMQTLEATDQLLRDAAAIRLACETSTTTA
ncbi:MAG: 3-deoxy-8-phosphooctulonate synthase [Phycisphaerales bacterium]|nr:3-deoxy-8-phosphooctulonate synthase [Phycisphaerales bacterium]